MKLSGIKIKNYRNISALETKIDPFASLLIANNGSGKTNFLESIFYSTFGNSFRPLDTVADIIKRDGEFCKIETEWQEYKLEVLLSTSNGRINKKVIFNNKSTTTLKVREKLKVLLFAPHSVDLVSGEPAIRRVDLDLFLSLCVKNYGYSTQKYRTILKNRNALIKNIRDGKSLKRELEYWTIELVKLSAEIFKLRYEFFTQIKDFIKEVALDLYYKENEFDIKYIPNIDCTPEEFIDTLKLKFESNVDKEIIVGKTLYGIHKDDYEFILNQKKLRFFGSRGQQRIGSFIFKAAQYRYLVNLKKEDIIFLIDDLMSELDVTHRENIANFLLKEKLQFILTGADIKEIPESLQVSSTLINLNND